MVNNFANKVIIQKSKVKVNYDDKNLYKRKKIKDNSIGEVHNMVNTT